MCYVGTNCGETFQQMAKHTWNLHAHLEESRLFLQLKVGTRLGSFQPFSDMGFIFKTLCLDGHSVQFLNHRQWNTNSETLNLYCVFYLGQSLQTAIWIPTGSRTMFWVEGGWFLVFDGNNTGLVTGRAPRGEMWKSDSFIVSGILFSLMPLYGANWKRCVRNEKKDLRYSFI